MTKKKTERKVRCFSRPLGNEGFAIVIALVMILVISLLAAASMKASVTEKWLSRNYSSSKGAFSSAEAGVHDALARLISGAISDAAQSSATWNSGSTYSSSSGFNNTFSVIHFVRNGAVVNDSTGKPYYRITSTGYDTASKGAQKTIEAVVSLSANMFEGAMTGCDGINAHGVATVDSWDSDTYGAYSAANARGNGSLATCNPNADISLSENVQINGSLTATGSIDIDYSAGTPYVSGSQISGAPTTTCDPLNVAALVASKTPASTSGKLTQNGSDVTKIQAVAGTTVYASYSQIKQTGGTLTFADPVGGGTGEVVLYVGAGGVQQSGGGQLVIGANVKLTIYSPGPLDFAGGGVLNNGLPTNLSIYSSMVSTTDQFAVKVAGNNSFSGGIYAPLGTVRIGGTVDYFGAVRGKYVDDGGTPHFHYDEALGKKPVEGFKGYSMISWKEVSR